MKFVMTQAVCPEGMQLLDGIADVYVADNQDPNNYLDEMRDAAALIVRIAKCDANAIENSPKLKVIGRTGVGYDSVDVKKATELGIPVVITPGANNRSVAEHAVAMIFALSKNLIEAQNEMCKGNWEIRGAKKAFELEGKTVGILGLGAIGRETAKICKGCGMRIAAYDPFMTKEQVEGYGAKYYEDYVELLKDSDVVSIHVPLTDQTRNMISKKELSVMKPTALIINCSRGGIINEAVAIWMPIIAIVAANSCGKIRSKMVIFPAGTAAIIGGACSLIGSTSQLAANSVLQGYAGYEEGMGMFDMTKIMFPAAVVQIIFWGTIGYKLLDKVLKPDSPDFDKGNMYSVAEIHKLEKEQESAAPAWKGYVALGTMILCIVLFVLSGFQPFKSYFNIGTIGLIGAAMVLGTGCISIKKAYSDLPWDVFVCIGTISGIGTGLDVSGGGALIANAVLNLFGGKNASVVLLTVVIAVLTSVLTNIMSNNATAAMLTPICIAIALSLGISPIPWVIVIGACSNLAIATSFGTAVNMQILPAGYKFSDFVKIGGPLLIILIAVVSICSVAFLF